MKIDVYTDGSATTKEKPGGYAWVIVIDGKFHSEGSGSAPFATNNDMELEGAIVGLANVFKYVDNLKLMMAAAGSEQEQIDRCISPEVTLVSDSEIVLGWLTGKYRFKQTSKNNKYESFMRLKRMMNVQARWVKGHDGDQWNERCDKLAGIERRKAMGIEPKKRVDKSKVLKDACRKMAEMLECVSKYISVASPQDAEIQNKIDDALESYRRIK